MNSPEEIRALVEATRKAHLNTIIAQVRHRGLTYYRSTIEPPAASWASQKEFDPLATLLQQAHANTRTSPSLAVYAWFNVFNFGDVEKTSLTREQRQRIRSWLSLTTTGSQTTFLDPAVPEVQEYLLSLIRECAVNYPIDGINLDYIRYPEQEAGYHPRAIDRFQRLYGRHDRPRPDDPQWNEFRREQITGFVRRCAAELWRTRPEAMLSVCAVGFGDAPPHDDFTRSSPYRQVHQDWASWIDQGCVDIVTRMGYKREHIPAHAAQFRHWADFSRRLQSRGPGNTVTIGIGGFFNSPDNVIVQYLEAHRRGLGTSLFSYWRPANDAAATTSGNSHPIWERIGRQVYADWCASPRPDWRRTRATLAVRCSRKDVPVDGETVALTGPIARTLRTDGNGWAIFTAVPLGKYEVRLPATGTTRRLDLATSGVVDMRLELEAQ